MVGFVAIWWAVKISHVARHFRLVKTPKLPKELPTVSVCIPARNEIHALTACLELVLASDYPKLEILVLDDNSADDTSVIIRSFAHEGIRFIAGQPLPDGWLGKNFALDCLAREASGTYIIYIDADTKLTRTSISTMVDIAVARNADMVSVIPDRYDTNRLSVLTGNLRYFWELLLSTRTSPPSSCAAWLINRDLFIDQIGGFTDVKSSVRPEAIIAAKVAEQSSYWAVVHSDIIGIGYEKRWTSQMETSRRLLYQIVGGRWYMGLAAIMWLLLLNLPTAVLITSFYTSWLFVDTVALLAFILLMTMYGIYLRYTWQSRWWLGVVFWPYVILQEFVSLIRSMIGYSMHTITWKGRVIERTRLENSTTF